MNSVLHRGRIRYGVILGVNGLDAVTRSVLTDSIQRIVERVGPRRRHSRHAPVVEVHNLASWNAAHPEKGITRRP